ncbi:MAG: hypothetical protein ACE5R6_02650 [Candidatus Heimdallarchaeota archaeon]
MWRVSVISNGEGSLEFRLADITNNKEEGIVFPNELLRKIIELSHVEEHYQLYFGLNKIIKGGKYELDHRERRKVKLGTPQEVSKYLLLFATPMEKLTNLNGVALLLRTIENGFETVGIWISDFTKAYGPESTDRVFSTLQLAITEPSLFLHVFLFFPTMKHPSH